MALRVRGGDVAERATRAVAGTLLDLSVVLPAVALLVVLLTLLTAALSRRARGATWQHLGAPLVGLPVCAALYLLTVAAQETKAERGAFPTLHEVFVAGADASFVESLGGFIRYERMWLPALTCGVLAALAMSRGVRGARRQGSGAAGGWALGLAGVLTLGTAVSWLLVAAQARLSPRLAAPALGDPLSAMAETAPDFAQGRAPPSPRELLLQLEPSAADIALGAARLGWPAPSQPVPGPGCRPHAYARPLEGERPSPAEPLLAALRRVSAALFPPDDPRVAVFQFSLESFRGADLHPLDPAAPRALAPFTASLYEAAGPVGSGVLASAKTWQAGVRTAHSLAAVTCGLGTLPYNLSIVRDLEGFPLRCATDVLAGAGFRGTFFYGADPRYDGMWRFLSAHGVSGVVSQDELPADLPTGAWAGVTDLALFDAALGRVAGELTGGQPQFALVMSLSNHSPFTQPADLPEGVRLRVDQAVAQTPNRASKDERLRLLTHAYTDAALEHFFQQLDAQGLAERAIVVLLADHSTGDDYVWGPPTMDHETDAAKALLPFVIVIPPAFLARARDRAALDVALAEAQVQLERLPLSQNDVPALLLALLSAHPGLRALPPAARWHTLGGQTSSPYFSAGGDDGAFVLGINGVDELYALDRAGERVAPYEDVVFLRTRGVREYVTPRLIPVAATLVDLLQHPPTCAP